MILWIALALSLALNAYLVFHETLNKIQYVQFLRLYWITRDIGKPGDPHIKRAFMRQTMPPYWRGKGVEFRFKEYTVQVGYLSGMATTLLDQLDGREMGESAKDIRQWN